MIPKLPTAAAARRHAAQTRLLVLARAALTQEFVAAIEIGTVAFGRVAEPRTAGHRGPAILWLDPSDGVDGGIGLAPAALGQTLASVGAGALAGSSRWRRRKAISASSVAWCARSNAA